MSITIRVAHSPDSDDAFDLRRDPHGHPEDRLHEGNYLGGSGRPAPRPVNRAAVGGVEAIISSNVKVAAAGTVIDIPLANKDDIWSFGELDTMSVMVSDAPRPDEILVSMAVSDGGRPHPRVGKGRAST